MTMALDPAALAIVRRAAELAQRRDSDEVTTQDFLHALSSRPLTPGLVRHFAQASSYAEDSGADFINDSHVFQAILSEENLVTSILAERLDLDELRHAFSEMRYREPTDG